MQQLAEGPLTACKLADDVVRHFLLQRMEGRMHAVQSSAACEALGIGIMAAAMVPYTKTTRVQHGVWLCWSLGSQASLWLRISAQPPGANSCCIALMIPYLL